MKNLHPLVQLGIILGGSFLVAVAISMTTLSHLRSDVVSVTGSAKMEVTSDQASGQRKSLVLCMRVISKMAMHRSPKMRPRLEHF
jgi:hypothetical protein